MSQNAEKSFEQLYQELDILVKSMESGQLSLDDSIKSYEKGMNLQQQCRERLSQAELKLEKIQVDFQ